MHKYYIQKILSLNGEYLQFQYQRIEPNITRYEFEHKEVISRNGFLDVNYGVQTINAKLDNGCIAGNFIFNSESDFQEFRRKIIIWEDEDLAPIKFAFSSDSHKEEDYNY